MTAEQYGVHTEFSRFGAHGMRVRVSGERSLEGTIAYWTQIVEQHRREREED